jgi:hypothetical protein
LCRPKSSSASRVHGWRGFSHLRFSIRQPLVFINYGEGIAHRSFATLLTRDAARQIAAGLAKLPDLVQWLSKAAH